MSERTLTDLETENLKLRDALSPFADLLNRRWSDKSNAIINVRRGGAVSETQAISLGDVLVAHDLLMELGAEIKESDFFKPRGNTLGG